MLAVSNDDKDEVKLLLSKGANPNASPPMVAIASWIECGSESYHVSMFRLSSLHSWRPAELEMLKWHVCCWTIELTPTAQTM